MILLLLWVFGLALASRGPLLELEEGDDCEPHGGGHGTCVLLSQCENKKNFKEAPICGFKGFEPIICCPPMLEQKVWAGSKLEQICQVVNIRCQSYLDLTKNVVGGTESAPRTHRFMVLIGYGETEKEWRCAGSLITARYVLSAAHCSESFGIGPAKWARLGELDIGSTSEDAKPVDKRIIKRIPYRKYKASEAYHDIALFKLDSDVEFNSYILPICLQTLKDIPEKHATVIGWGRTGFTNDISKKLLQADIKIYNDTECNRLMFSTNSPKTLRGHQPEQMICAGVPDGSKDACLGDSGGPLVIHEIGKCSKTQVGITSFGKECGNPDSPGVYTRVSNYIAWIEEVAFGDETNFCFSL